MKWNRQGLRSLCASTMLALATAAICEGADWPEFRGPTGQGHADPQGLPLKWSGTENITWKVNIPGVAWSSPIVVKGRIYLTTAATGTEERQELRALCLDAANGQTIWDRELFTHTSDVQIHKKNSHASPTPLIDGETIYVHFGPHGTAALSLTGELLWKQKLDYAPVHGNGGSPALAGDLLIICCDGSDEQYVAALDKGTGDIRWKTPRDLNPSKGFSFCTPLILTVNGQPQAICPGSDGVIAFNPADGKEIWRVRYPGGYSVIPRPVAGNGLVYVCSGYNRPSLYAIDPSGTGDITDTHVRWSTDRAVPHSASLLLVDNLLYFVSDSGIATCVDAASGEERWHERLGGNFSASPIYAEGRIYFQAELGEAIVIEAAPQFRELARNQIVEEERTYSSYAVSEGALFIRSENHLFRVQNAAQ